MFDIVYEWIKNLAFYLVIMTAVLEVLPGDTYKKYIRFFSGMVLILLVITPVMKLTGSFGVFQEKYQRKEEELQREIEKQRAQFEEADVFDFLPEEYLIEEMERDKETYRTENRMQENGTGMKEEQVEKQEVEAAKAEAGKMIKVEEIRIGEDEEPDMESDAFRE